MGTVAFRSTLTSNLGETGKDAKEGAGGQLERMLSAGRRGGSGLWAVGEVESPGGIDPATLLPGWSDILTLFTKWCGSTGCVFSRSFSLIHILSFTLFLSLCPYPIFNSPMQSFVMCFHKILLALFRTLLFQVFKMMTLKRLRKMEKSYFSNNHSKLLIMYCK